MEKVAHEELAPVRAFWTAAAEHAMDHEGLRPTARDPYLQIAVESAIEKWLTGGRLLDVGCGDGLSTLRFARRMDDVLGIDYIANFVDRATANAWDTARMTATMVWQYSADPPIFNDFTGSAQRLKNGNTLVAWTRKGIVDEVRSDGSLVSRITLQAATGRTAMPYRVTRISSLYRYAPP